MGNQRRVFAEEYKQEAVRRMNTGEETVAGIARELGVKATLLQTWRRKAATESKAAGAQVPVSFEEENRRLRRENASRREDREILKKAAAFFAKESR